VHERGITDATKQTKNRARLLLATPQCRLAFSPDFRTTLSPGTHVRHNVRAHGRCNRTTASTPAKWMRQGERQGVRGERLCHGAEKRRGGM